MGLAALWCSPPSVGLATLKGCVTRGLAAVRGAHCRSVGFVARGFADRGLAVRHVGFATVTSGFAVPRVSNRHEGFAVRGARHPPVGSPP